MGGMNSKGAGPQGKPGSGVGEGQGEGDAGTSLGRRDQDTYSQRVASHLPCLGPVPVRSPPPLILYPKSQLGGVQPAVYCCCPGPAELGSGRVLLGPSDGEVVEQTVYMTPRHSGCGRQRPRVAGPGRAKTLCGRVDRVLAWGTQGLGLMI